VNKYHVGQKVGVYSQPTNHPASSPSMILPVTVVLFYFQYIGEASVVFSDGRPYRFCDDAFPHGYYYHCDGMGPTTVVSENDVYPVDDELDKETQTTKQLEKV
jgi:hypothetical protein